MSIEAVVRGVGFAWLPEVLMRSELQGGILKPLPMLEGGERFADLFIILPNRDLAGPAALRCEKLLRSAVAELVC
jgi:DNA-binding transcriptional LysR family regulator